MTHKYTPMLGLVLFIGLVLLIAQFADPRTVGTVLLVMSFLAITVFVGRYLRTRWEATADGRHMMTFSVVVFAVLGWATSNVLLGTDHWIQPYLRVAVYGGMIYVLVWRDVMLFLAQREKRRARETLMAAGVGPRSDNSETE